MGADRTGIGGPAVGGGAGDAFDVQADQIGMHLFAHTHKSLHEGGADLAAEQAANLD